VQEPLDGAVEKAYASFAVGENQSPGGQAPQPPALDGFGGHIEPPGHRSRVVDLLAVVARVQLEAVGDVEHKHQQVISQPLAVEYPLGPGLWPITGQPKNHKLVGIRLIWVSQLQQVLRCVEKPLPQPGQA